MNIIIKHPVNELGYNFIEPQYLPAGKDEYYLRFEQNPNAPKSGSLLTLLLCFIAGMVAAIMFWWLIRPL